MEKRMANRIGLSQEAASLFKNIVTGCIVSKTTDETLEKIDHEMVLSNVITEIPTAINGLSLTALKNHTNILSSEDVIECYMGETHLEIAKMQLEHCDFCDQKTKSKFRDILKDLKIDIKKPLNYSAFLISDFVLLGKVIKAENKLAMVLINFSDNFDEDHLRFYNVVCPKHIILHPEDLVLVHLGYIAMKVTEEHHEICKKLHRKTVSYESIKHHFTNIVKNGEGFIDFNNFCPTKKRGCNLTKIQLENFYNRA